MHKHIENFNELVTLVAIEKHLPESAIVRDYYIVKMLENLSLSVYADRCVFKGGTSLSKCYPNSIDRFSEDIDLTFLGMDKNDKYCDREIKKIEEIMTLGFNTEKIIDERNKRNED